MCSTTGDAQYKQGTSSRPQYKQGMQYQKGTSSVQARMCSTSKVAYQGLSQVDTAQTVKNDLTLKMTPEDGSKSFH